MRIRILSFVLASFLLLSVSGCGIIDYYFLPKPEDTAQELYEAGVEAMKDKSYDDAAEYFGKLKDRYPFSPFTVKAEVSLGDAYFLEKNSLMHLKHTRNLQPFIRAMRKSLTSCIRSG